MTLCIYIYALSQYTILTIHNIYSITIHNTLQYTIRFIIVYNKYFTVQHCTTMLTWGINIVSNSTTLKSVPLAGALRSIRCCCLLAACSPSFRKPPRYLTRAVDRPASASQLGGAARPVSVKPRARRRASGTARPPPGVGDAARRLGGGRGQSWYRVLNCRWRCSNHQRRVSRSEKKEGGASAVAKCSSIHDVPESVHSFALHAESRAPQAIWKGEGVSDWTQDRNPNISRITRGQKQSAGNNIKVTRGKKQSAAVIYYMRGQKQSAGNNIIVTRGQKQSAAVMY